MQGDGWLFFGIIAFLFILWLGTGGPTRPISFEGPFIAPLTGPGDVGEGYGDGGSVLSAWKDDVGDGVDYVTDGGLRESISSAGFSNASPYKDLVSIDHSVSAFREKDPDDEYFTIAVSRHADPITVSGWRVEQGSSGKSLPIPYGAKVPRSGTVNQTAPITLQPGDIAVVSVGTSPIGVSFAANLCTGYLDEYQSFTPPLPQYCPAPSDEYEHHYTGTDDRCEEYVDKLEACSAARPGSNVSGECRAFANAYLTYNGCVAAHGQEDDFFDGEWRIFLGSSKEFFTREHDTLRLIDSAGKTVDVLSY